MIQPVKVKIPSSPAQLRRKIFWVVIRLIGAQAGYCLLARSIIQSGRPFPSQHDPHVTVILAVGVAVAALFPPGSIWIVNHRPKLLETADWSTVATALMRQFFMGFALSQVAALIGLTLFFIYGWIISIVITAVFTSVGILWNYLNVRRKSYEFEQRQRELKPLTLSP